MKKFKFSYEVEIEAESQDEAEEIFSEGGCRCSDFEVEEK